MVTNLDAAAVAHQRKTADEIIRSATFPAARAPSPDDSSRSEGDCWPRSLVVLGTVGCWWVCLRFYLLLERGSSQTSSAFFCCFFLTFAGWTASLHYCQLLPAFSQRVGFLLPPCCFLLKVASLFCFLFTWWALRLPAAVSQMTWTEITETDFKPLFVRRTIYFILYSTSTKFPTLMMMLSAVMSVWPNIPMSPPVCLSRQLCLRFVLKQSTCLILIDHISTDCFFLSCPVVWYASSMLSPGICEYKSFSWRFCPRLTCRFRGKEEI